MHTMQCNAANHGNCSDNVYNLTCELPYKLRHCTSLHPHQLYMSVLGFAILIACTILILNVIILSTFRSKDCRTPINNLVFGLCCEDFVTALFVIPLFAATFYCPNIFFNYMCNLYGVAVVMISMASGFTVCLISILQMYAYLSPLDYRYRVTTSFVRRSACMRYIFTIVMTLPLIVKQEFYFQYDESAHICTFNGGHSLNHTDGFTYLSFVTKLYTVLTGTQMLIMLITVVYALCLITAAHRQQLARSLSVKHIRHKHKMTRRTTSVSSRVMQRVNILSEGLLLSLSYLIGFSVLLVSQINTYILPTRYQISEMVECDEWGLLKTSTIFLTSLFNQCAVGLKNRRIRHQIELDYQMCIGKSKTLKKGALTSSYSVGDEVNKKRLRPRNDWAETTFDTELGSGGTSVRSVVSHTSVEHVERIIIEVRNAGTWSTLERNGDYYRGTVEANVNCDPLEVVVTKTNRVKKNNGS